MSIKLIGKNRKKIDFIFKLNDLFDRKEKLEFLIVIITALLMAVFQALGIASILPFINIIMNPDIIQENHWLKYFFVFFDFKTENSFIVASGFAVIGFLVIGNMISAFSTWLKINFVWRKNHKLSSDLLKKYLSMPYVYFLNQNTSNLGKNVLAEVQQLTSNFLMPLTKIITDILVIIIILSLLFYVNLLMTLIAMAVLVSAYFSIYYHFSEKLKIGGEKRLKENMGRYKSAQEALGGIKDMKILRIESFFLDRFSRHSDEFSYLQSWYKVTSELPRYFMEIIAFGGIVGLLIFLVSSNISTQKVIPLISFFAFAGYRLMPALQEIFISLTDLKFNKVILDQIHKDITSGTSGGNLMIKRNEAKPINFKNEIILENIYFSYPGAAGPVLKDINLCIKKNTFVALIGATGAGKTTLVDIILGLLVSDRGSFKVDGIEINDKNIENWQANLGYVPQQIYLSDDTIARNIAFGLPDEKIDMEKVKKAAQMANIHDFIDEELPKSYHTVVGERGIRLSGGQRQRIGIARALYHDPEILIFDEATSSLDNATEKEVLDAINKVAKFKTMIVIAHRLTTVKDSSVVYRMEKGAIVERGNYEKIVGNG